MFADNTKIFREIKTLGGASSLQKDLGKLAIWSQSSGLLFNEAKCKAQHITLKTKPILSSNKHNNTALLLYSAKKYLGVWISKDLTWYKQVNEQSSRTHKLLGYLKGNTRFILRTDERRTLYLVLVRPHLGYSTQIWAPQSIEFIVKLERIQRRATKFMLKLPYSSNISYKSRLQTLNLIPICYWHKLLDLTFFFFKSTHGLVKYGICRCVFFLLVLVFLFFFFLVSRPTVTGHSCCGVPANVLSVCLFVCFFGEANKIK